MVSVSGVILSWNRAAESIFGILREEALGRDLIETIVVDDRMEDARSELQSAIAAGEAGFEYVCRGAKASRVHVDLSLRVIAATGTPSHVVLCLRDVTEPKVRRQAAELEVRFRGASRIGPRRPRHRQPGRPDRSGQCPVGASLRLRAGRAAGPGRGDARAPALLQPSPAGSSRLCRRTPGAAHGRGSGALRAAQGRYGVSGRESASAPWRPRRGC